MLIAYRDRVYINQFRCIDHIRTIRAIKYFRQGELLYCYRDRYNIITIAINDIISIEEI